MMRIKKGDYALVITGKDKGKKGVVLAVFPKKGKIKVQGVSLMTRHYKAKRRGETSTVKQIEGNIALSNVMLFDAKANKPCRVGFVNQENGVKVRVNAVTKEAV